MSNLELWEKIERTDPKHTKAITGKSYQGTSPKPHYLVHKATEAFGPCGIGWGFTIVSERIEEGAGGERMHIAHVRVWYEWQGKRGEVEHIGGTQFSGIRSSGKPFTDEDAPKKSITDALVKALSMIGFAGDIFMGRYDDSKYVNELRNDTPERSSEPRVAPNSSPLLQDRVEKGTPLRGDRLTPEESKKLLGKLKDGLDNQPAKLEALHAWKAGQRVGAAIESLTPDHRVEFMSAYEAACKMAHPAKAEVPPDFTGLEQGKDGYVK